MTRQIILHIGLHKTGTTYLQNMLFDLEDWLLKHGVLYPRTGLAYAEGDARARFQKSGHTNLIPALSAPDSAIGKALLNTLGEQIEEHNPDTIFLSSENFFDPNNKIDAQKIKEGLGRFGHVRPLVYLRRQDEFIESLYLEQLSWRRLRLTRPLWQFIKFGNPWMDYHNRISSWSSGFADDDWIVKSYSDIAAQNGLLADVLSVAGIKASPPKKIETDKRIRSSINPELACLLLAVNRMEGVSADAKDAFLDVLRTDPEWATPAGPRPSLIADDVWYALANKYTKINQKLVKQRVTGPSDALLFPKTRPLVYRAQQRFLPAEAVRKASEILWSCHAASTQLEPLPKVRPRVGMMTHVTAPSEATHAWLKYHLNQGIDRILVCHDTADADALARMSVDPRIDTLVLNVDDLAKHALPHEDPILHKDHIVHRLGRAALMQSGLDWTVFFEQSELLHGNILNDLSTVAADIDLVRLAPWEAINHDAMSGPPHFQNRYFLTQTKGVSRAPLKTHGDVQGSFGFFGDVAGKMLVRTTTKIDFFSPSKPQNTSIYHAQRLARDAVILCFDCGDYDAWRVQWNKRATQDTPDHDIPESRQAQSDIILPLIYAEDEAELKKLYRDWFYFDPSRIADLQNQKIIASIDLEGSLFI